LPPSPEINIRQIFFAHRSATCIRLHHASKIRAIFCLTSLTQPPSLIAGSFSHGFLTLAKHFQKKLFTFFTEFTKLRPVRHTTCVSDGESAFSPAYNRNLK